MREVIRGLILFILGVLILLSICAGMWGMAEIISFINANYERAANVAPTHVTPTQTPDWEATVNALSTDVANVAGKGMSPEQVEAAIAATLQAMILEVGGPEELATILPTDELPVVATALAETVMAAGSGCPDLPDPIKNIGKIVKTKKQFMLIMTFEYAQDPANCFIPHPTEEGWYIAGWTEVTVGDDEPNDENTWKINDSHAIREWDGKTIVIRADIFLDRIGDDFTSLWAEYQNDYSALSWKVHMEDYWGHSLTCRLVPDDEDTCP
jgi:hypothetical protein